MGLKKDQISLVCRYLQDHELAGFLLGRSPKKALGRQLRDEARDSESDAVALRALADELDPD